jgi:hypothetical protein
MPVTSPLLPWQNFYVIVGSAAAALTGLMFIVITLVGDRSPGRNERTLAAFGTPNVLHFCAAFLVAMYHCAPWPSLGGFAVALGITGGAGVVYVFFVFRHASLQTDYKPVLEDWLWHNIFPFMAYGAMIVCALLVGQSAVVPLFVVAAAAALLVFIGIHNAWDTVTYMYLLDGQRKAREAAKSYEPPTP